MGCPLVDTQRCPPEDRTKGLALNTCPAASSIRHRHLGLWEVGVRVDAARDPPEPPEPVIEPWLDDPFPDYDHEPVFAEN